MESETKMPPNPARQIREPSLTLAELVGLFGKSAGDENLDMPSRELAARMCVLARYVELLNARLGMIHNKTLNGFKAHDKALAEQDKALAELIETLQPVLMEQAGQNQAAPQDAAPKDGEEVDDEAEQLIARAQRESASDVAEMEAMARAQSAQKQQVLPPAQTPPPPPALPVQQAAPATQPVRRANKKNGGAA